MNVVKIVLLLGKLPSRHSADQIDRPSGTDGLEPGFFPARGGGFGRFRFEALAFHRADVEQAAVLDRRGRLQTRFRSATT